jgi:membrane protein YqaA with SNARE-associated domain
MSILIAACKMQGQFGRSLIQWGIYRLIPGTINQEVIVSRGNLFDQLKIFIEGLRDFVVGQPVLFVLAMGLVIAVTSVLGEVLTYWIARLGGRPLVFRFSRWLRVDTRHIDRAEAMFTRWGVGLVMFGRILPGLRTLVSVPAGVTRMNFGLFIGASFGGAYLWNTLLVAAGYLLGFKLAFFGFSIL